MSNLRAGYYELKKALIFSYGSNKGIDITSLIPAFNIEESLDSDSVRGILSVYDAVGFLEDLPIRGEESLILEVEDSTKKIYKFSFSVYKVSNVRVVDGNDAVLYNLHFTSPQRFLAGKRRIVKPFEDTISEISQMIFDEYYVGEKKLIKEETDGVFRCVIPNYTPMQAMNFLSSRAFSQTSPSCSFRFFENQDSFFFVSDEFLIRRAIENEEDIKEFIFSDALNKSGKQYDQEMQNIIQLENPDRVNTMTDLYSGAYTNNVIEIDLVKKVVENRRFTYKTGKFSGMSNKDVRGVHSENFVNDFFNVENERKFLVVKDYTSIGDTPSNIRGEQFLPEIVSNRISYRHHLNNTVVNVKTNGRLDVKVGDVVKLNVLEFTSNTNKKGVNKQLSGNYLVNDCSQFFNNEKHETSMKLIKYDWSS